MSTSEELLAYPGGDLVLKGLKDLEGGVASIEGVLLLVAKTRLRGLGIPVPEIQEVRQPYEHSLYELIEEQRPEGAHAEYNALIGRIVSFAQTYGRAGK